MSILADIQKNKRVWPRYNVMLQAHCFSLGCALNIECTIIDISKGGASIRLQKCENISCGMTIIVNITNKKLQDIAINGTIAWIKRAEESYFVGIKFKKLLDADTLLSIG